ncbi:MAG: pirin family protein [Candidatus Sumerlaeia bacterium]|nr:pirin family protein [Candidatus Sumerlaeia bacterium]
MKLKLHPKSALAKGAFDGGSITEIKPIAFPGEGGAIKRLGPLFYWAWATAPNGGVIGLHPHRGFEIMSYVLDGELGHYDTLGTKSRVGAGGAQVMRTASGVSHEEHMLGSPTVFYQIWFEPDMRKALQEPAAYQEVRHGDFPETEPAEGVRVKEVLGAGSPVDITVDAGMWEVTLQPGAVWEYAPVEGRGGAVLVARGNGSARGGEEAIAWKAEEFVEIHGDGSPVAFTGGGQGAVIHVVEVPLEVPWALYEK